jgi:hypothetical protein
MKYIRMVPWLLVPLVAARAETSRAARDENPPVRVLAVEVPADAAITSDVLAAIQNDDILRYYAGSIQVSAHGAVVTLDGSVPRAAIRQRMAQVAHAVAGVSRVVNLIAVPSKG